VIAVFPGEISALTAAFLWAVASLLFQRAGPNIPPVVLNLYKGLIATGFLVVSIWFFQQSWRPISMEMAVILILSGIIGIGIGDTAFFASLNRLGERRTLLIVEILAPPIAVVAAWLSLSEVLSITAALGIIVTISGVAWTLIDRTNYYSISSKFHKRGIYFGVTSATCQGVGAVLSRYVLTETDILPLWSTVVRIGGGMVFLICWLSFTGHDIVNRVWITKKMFVTVFLATFLGTFLGLFLQQISLKYTTAGIAQTLLATSSLFIIPLVVLRGEKVNFHSICGVILALFGIGILFIPV